MTKASIRASDTTVCGIDGSPVLGRLRERRTVSYFAAMEVTRERAWETLTEHTQSEALRRHALAVEAAVGKRNKIKIIVKS